MGVDQSIQQDKRNLVKRSFEVFKSKDANVVKAEDFSALLIQDGYSVNPKVIKLIFCLIDTNHNGDLSLLEFQKFFKLLIEKYDFNLYKTLMSSMDTNKNGLLERKEIIAGFKSANFDLDESKLKEKYNEEEFIALLHDALGD